MKTLVFHPVTERRLQQLVATPSHAVGLVAPTGAGKSATAQWVIARILGVEDISSYPYYRHIAPENNQLSIEQVREIEQFVGLKTPGTHAIRRAVLIEDAESLSLPAQQALLKTLEEPPADTIIILTLRDERAVLPTIRSRLQIIKLRQPIAEDLKEHFVKTYSEPAVQAAYALSGGQPGLLHDLLDESLEHPLKANMTTAKQLMQASAFERLALIDGLSKDKTQALAVLDAASRLAQAGLRQAASKHDDKLLQRWQRLLQSTESTTAALQANGQAKLALTAFVLAL